MQVRVKRFDFRVESMVAPSFTPRAAAKEAELCQTAPTLEAARDPGSVYSLLQLGPARQACLTVEDHRMTMIAITTTTTLLSCPMISRPPGFRFLGAPRRPLAQTC